MIGIGAAIASGSVTRQPCPPKRNQSRPTTARCFPPPPQIGLKPQPDLPGKVCQHHGRLPKAEGPGRVSCREDLAGCFEVRLSFPNNYVRETPSASWSDRAARSLIHAPWVRNYDQLRSAGIILNRSRAQKDARRLRCHDFPNAVRPRPICTTARMRHDFRLTVA